MPAFRKLEVWQDVQCAPALRLAVVADKVGIEPIYDLTGDESLQVTLPRSSAALPLMQAKRVLSIVRRKADGTDITEEWRITDSGDSSMVNDDLATVTARPILLDLGDAVIRQEQADGSTAYTFGFVGLTLSEVWDTYCAPALAAIGKAWILRKTFDFVGTFDYDFSRESVLSLMRALADKFALELRVTRDADGVYRINLLTELGSGAPMPRVELRKNLAGTRRQRSTAEQTTRAIPHGPDTGGGEHVGIENVRWIVTAIDPITKRITIADELGIFTAIAFDGQLTSWSYFRDRTGGTWPIVTTYKATQQLRAVTLPPLLAVGERIYLRSADFYTNTLNWRGHLGIRPFYMITAVNAGTKRLTLADSVTGGTGQVQADGDMVDWDCYSFQKIAVFTWDAADQTGQYYHASGGPDLSAVHVGDVAFIDLGSGVNPSFGNSPNFAIGNVTAVDNVLKRITVSNRYNPGAAVITGGGLAGAGKLRVYRRSGHTSMIVNSLAATNEIELLGISGEAVNDLVEVRQVSGGTLPIALDAPAALLAYGQIERIIDRPDVRGETNLVPNPYQRTWSGIATVPADGWSISGAVTLARTSDPLYVKYGPYAAVLAFTGAGEYDSPGFNVWRVGVSQRTRVSFRVRLTFTNFSGNIELDVSLKGSVSGIIAGSMKRLCPVDHPTAADADKYAVGTAYEVGLASVDLTTAMAGEKFSLVFAATGAMGVVPDAVMVTQTTYDPGVFIEASAACELWNEANRHLDEFAEPLIEYSVELKDLERIDGTPWPNDAIVLGGKINLVDTVLGITATPRVVRYAPKELDPLSSEVTLSTRKRSLSRILTA